MVQSMVTFANVSCRGNVFVTSNVGTPTSPFGTLFVNRMNVATMNASSFQLAQQIITSDIIASNAFQGTNLFTTSMNVAGVSNAFSMSVNAPNMGIGTLNSLIVIPGALTYTSLTPGPPIYAFGYYSAISADGSTIISSNSPYAVVYKYDGSSWGSYQLIITSSGTSGIAYSVALSSDGTTALIGDYYANGQLGYVASFKYSGGSWVNEQQLVSSAPGGGPYIRFGRSVALSADGNTALVGAPEATGSADGWAGVYRYSGGVWSSATSLVSTAGYGASFGWCVALSSDGNTSIVGANGTYIGVYKYSGGVWSSATQISVSISGALPQVTGLSVTGDGNIVVAGFPNYSSETGIVGVYNYSGGSWRETFIYSSAGASARFGQSVSISPDGNTIAVGAILAAPNSQGWAAKYTYSGGSWGSPTQLVYSTPVFPTNTYFGNSIGVASGGARIMVGTQTGAGVPFVVQPSTYGNPSLLVQGNVYVSNSTTLSVTTNTFTTTTINTVTLITTGPFNPVYVVPGVTAVPGGPVYNIGFGRSVAVSADGFSMITFAQASAGGFAGGSVLKLVGNVYGYNWDNSNPTLLNYPQFPSPTNTSGPCSISSDGTTVVMADPTYAGRGRVLVWKYNTSTTNWDVGPVLDGNTNSSYGNSVSLSADGNVLVIGIPYTGSPYDTGNVVVLTYSNGVWSTQLLSFYAGGAGSMFGYSVAISADASTILVGAPGAAVAQLYNYNGTWNPVTTITAGFVASDYFGYSVALSYNGQMALIGAPAYTSVGTAISYGYGGINTLTSSGLTSGANFGSSVAISPDGYTAVVSAPYNGGGLYPHGWAASYTFSTQTSTWSSPVPYTYSPYSLNIGITVAYSDTGVLLGTTSGFFLYYPRVGYPINQGANFSVTGNAWVSNIIKTTNVYATTLNAATMNSATVSTLSVDVGTNVSASTFEVLGNVYASNALVTQNVFANIFSTRSNATLMNAFSTLTAAKGGIINFNTSSINILSISTPFAYSIGNVFASNTLSGSNLLVTNTIYYNEDTTKRSIYLQPNSQNAPAIQSVISAGCNASTKSYWCTSPAPVYGNVLSVSATSNAYSGGVYLPDGRVVFVPLNSTNIGLFNPLTLTFTSVTGVSPGYNGGVLLPNGNVLFVPQTANICQFNPVSSKFSNVLLCNSLGYNGVVGLEGVYLTPSRFNGPTSCVALYTATTNQLSYLFQIEQFPSVGAAAATAGAVSGQSVSWSSSLGLFASVTSAGTTYSSSDGKSWSSSTSLAALDTFAGPWVSIAGGNTGTYKFVAVGQAGTYNSAYSTDGVNWSSYLFTSLKTLSSTCQWQYANWNSAAGRFEAVGYDSFYGVNFAYSSDGRNWSSGPGLPSDTLWTSVTSDPSGYSYAVGSVGGATVAAYLSGPSWTAWPGSGAGTTLNSIGYVWNSIAYSPVLNIFVAVGGTGGATWPAAAWIPGFPSAPNWTAASPSLMDIDPFSNWYSVSWSPENGVFVAVGAPGGSGSTPASAYSTNGKSWYRLSPSLYSISSSTTWRGIAWSSSLKLWAAVGTSGSTNGGYITVGIDGYSTGSVLLPTGNVLFSPIGTANIMQFQFQPGSLYISNIVVGTDKFNGLVLAPNGNVITVPSGSNIYVINPTTRTSTNIGPIAGSVTNFFRGGTLLASGNIVFTPGTSANVGMFDPIALTYSNGVAVGTAGISFSGSTLLPSGQVSFTPYDSANVGILDTFAPSSQELCLSPYFNKF